MVALTDGPVRAFPRELSVAANFVSDFLANIPGVVKTFPDDDAKMKYLQMYRKFFEKNRALLCAVLEGNEKSAASSMQKILSSLDDKSRIPTFIEDVLNKPMTEVVGADWRQAEEL